MANVTVHIESIDLPTPFVVGKAAQINFLIERAEGDLALPMTVFVRGGLNDLAEQGRRALMQFADDLKQAASDRSVQEKEA